MSLKDFIKGVPFWKQRGTITIGAIDRFLITVFPDRLEVTDILNETTTIHDPIFSEVKDKLSGK